MILARQPDGAVYLVLGLGSVHRVETPDALNHLRFLGVPVYDGPAIPTGLGHRTDEDGERVDVDFPDDDFDPCFDYDEGDW